MAPAEAYCNQSCSTNTSDQEGSPRRLQSGRIRLRRKQFHSMMQHSKIYSSALLATRINQLDYQSVEVLLANQDHAWVRL